MENNYEIKLPQFEGPFDLLLFFIERDELDINEISIAQITNDFLEFIQKMQALNMDLASEFIFVAATLMRIKVKTLLPRPELDQDGEEIDPQKELIQKLVLYKQFKEICEDLKILEANRAMHFKRGNVRADLKKAAENHQNSDELDALNLYKLLTVYDRLMFSYTNRTSEARHTVEKYPYTIEQQKTAVASLIEINKKLDFQIILKNSENKVQFVYNFLAILEMLQQQLIDIQVGLGYNNFWVRNKETV